MRGFRDATLNRGGSSRALEEPSRIMGERMRNVAWDYAHEIGDRVAGLADKYGSIIVLENLNHEE